MEKAGGVLCGDAALLTGSACEFRLTVRAARALAVGITTFGPKAGPTLIIPRRRAKKRPPRVR